MKRTAMIITFAWPPMEGVGVTRALKFAKYLPAYGWDVVVLTADHGTAREGDADRIAAPAGVRVVKTGYKDILAGLKRLAGRPAARPPQAAGLPVGAKRRKTPSLLRELVLMPDDQIGWYEFAVREGKRIMAGQRIDVLISTSPPETAHLVARRLKKECRVPWIADLRDLWSDDHFRPRLPVKRFLLRGMERRVLGDADRVITVSGPWADVLRRSLDACRGRVEVIENGFDDEDFGSPHGRRNDRFTIVYTGKLHEDAQPVTALFRVLRDLVREGRIDRRGIEVRFHILGYDKPDIAGMARSYGLEDVVCEREKVSYHESLRVQQAADVLLFVQWQGRNGDGWYSAKLYDYLGARRPILALGRRGGIIDELVTKTGSGTVAGDDAELGAALVRFYDEYRRTGQVLCRADDEEVSRHTRRVRAERLAGVCDSVASGR